MRFSLTRIRATRFLLTYLLQLIPPLVPSGFPPASSWSAYVAQDPELCKAGMVLLSRFQDSGTQTIQNQKHRFNAWQSIQILQNLLSVVAFQILHYVELEQGMPGSHYNDEADGSDGEGGWRMPRTH